MQTGPAAIRALAIGGVARVGAGAAYLVACVLLHIFTLLILVIMDNDIL